MGSYRNIMTVTKSLYRFLSKSGCHLFVVLPFIFSFACTYQSKQDKADNQKHTATDAYSLSTFRLENGKGYGYEILKNNHVFIHQEFIPALEGKQFFKSSEEAKKIGDEVLRKVKNNKPPGITREEVLRLLEDPGK